MIHHDELPDPPPRMPLGFVVLLVLAGCCLVGAVVICVADTVHRKPDGTLYTPESRPIGVW